MAQGVGIGYYIALYYCTVVVPTVFAILYTACVCVCSICSTQHVDPVVNSLMVANRSNRKSTHPSPNRETQIKVGDTPTIFYAPDFVTDTEEQQILDSTYAPPPGANSSDEWVTLTSRRLKCFGGQPGEGEGFVPETLPAWVEALCDALVERGIFSSEDRPNHVLLNGKGGAEGVRVALF